MHGVKLNTATEILKTPVPTFILFNADLHSCGNESTRTLRGEKRGKKKTTNWRKQRHFSGCCDQADQHHEQARLPWHPQRLWPSCKVIACNSTVQNKMNVVNLVRKESLMKPPNIVSKNEVPFTMSTDSAAGWCMAMRKYATKLAAFARKTKFYSSPTNCISTISQFYYYRM